MVTRILVETLVILALFGAIPNHCGFETFGGTISVWMDVFPFQKRVPQRF